MSVGGIDSNRIQSMLQQMRAAAQKPEIGQANPLQQKLGMQSTGKLAESSQVSFSDALKASLDQVNNAQKNAEQMGQRFVLGDDKVSLSDVMIEGQKANIAFQATVQVRNKLVSAYQDIMNMPV